MPSEGNARRLSGRIVLSVLLLQATSALALADDASLTFPPSIQVEIDSARGEIERMATEVLPQSRFHPPNEFCTTSAAAEALPLWKQVSAVVDESLPRKRRDLIPGLALMVKRCNWSEHAIRNASFLLDYMYWNRISDTTGEEIADTLKARDVFNVLYIGGKARNLAQKNWRTFKGETEKCADFIDAGPMSKIDVLRKFGVLLNALSSEKREAVNAVAQELDLREQMISIFGKDILALLNHPDDVRVINEFYAYLREAQKNPKLLGEAHGGWRRLHEITRGDGEQAIRLVGTLATMRFWELDELGYALGRRGLLSTEQLNALYSGAMTYFVLNQLDERSAFDSPKNEYQVDYHFFYPPGYTSTDWKFYHWYANAFLACKLVKRGIRPETATWGVRSLAKAYEAATLNLNGPSRLAMEVDPRINPILEGWDDVSINTEGGDYGARLCSKAH